VEYGKYPLLLSATISFITAVIIGFFLHRSFTFKAQNGNAIRQYVKFFLTSCIGLGLNTLILSLFVYVFNVWYIFAKCIASGCVFSWNFLINKFWTFHVVHISRPNFFPTSSDIIVSVIIPAYNEEAVIQNCITSVHPFFERKNITHEIIVIDDGSTDATAERAETMRASIDSLRVISYKKNKGKGYAVRSGVQAAQGKYILFMDADSSTPIDAYDALSAVLDKGNDIAIGSRYLKESAIYIRQPKQRILLGRIGNLLIRLILLQGIHDTQCGFKLFTTEAGKAIFSKQRIERWGFDMEALAIGLHMGFRIQEVPVSWRDDTRRASRFRPIKDAYKTLGELFKIKLNLTLNKYQ